MVKNLLLVTALAVGVASVAEGTIQWPVGPAGTGSQTRTLFTCFGDFNPPWNSVGTDSCNFHIGIDILPYNGNSDVRAAKDGYFSIIDSRGGQWFAVIVDDYQNSSHGWGYQHLTDPFSHGWTVGPEEPPISQNSLIATMSPIPQHPHLHFHWVPRNGGALGGSDVNPLDFLMNADSLTWEWNRGDWYDVLLFIPDMPIQSWPDNSSNLDTLDRNSLYGNIDILYGYCLEARGAVGNPGQAWHVTPQKIEWTLSRLTQSGPVNQFDRYVVDFSGLLGRYPQDNTRYQQHFFRLSDYHKAGISTAPAGRIVCITNADDVLGYDGINNIEENSWQTNQHISGSGTAPAPELALYKDGLYQIQVTSYAHNDSSHQFTDSVTVDNFAPHVESVLVYLEALPGEPDTVYSAEWALATESLRFLADSTRMYLSSDEEQWIGVALKLSEPMDSLPDVWITGEWGGEVRWSSDSIDQFTPCEWDELNLGEMPLESNGSGFWQCYRTELGITGYHGNLRLNIGGGIDLSGNLLDGNPATVAVRDPQNGVFSGYEQVVDASYEWQVEPPMYQPNDQWPCHRYVTGYYTPNSGSGALILPLDPGQRAMFFVPSYQFSWGPPGEGRCPYWHGFWLAGAALVGGTGNSYKVLITGFDGRTSASFTGNTRFPFNQFEEPNYSGINNHWMILSGAGMGDYCWIGVTSVSEPARENLQSTDIPGPDGYIYLDVHCFTATGGYAEYPIASGASVYWHSFTHHPSDENKIIVKYRLSSGGAVHTTVLTPPGSDGEFHEVERITLEDERQSMQDEGSVNVFGLSVSCNPVSSLVMLQVSLEQAGIVELTIHDLTGREVQRVLDEEMPEGVHSLASQVNLPSGVYFCRLRSGGDIATGKVVIVR